jgi:hypothetical protein
VLQPPVKADPAALVEVLAARLGLLAEGGDVQEHRLLISDAVDSDAHGTEGGAFGRLAELGIGGQPPGERESVHGISLPCERDGLMRDLPAAPLRDGMHPAGVRPEAVLHAVAARPAWKLIRPDPAHTGQASISGIGAGEAQAMGA